LETLPIEREEPDGGSGHRPAGFRGKRGARGLILLLPVRISAPVRDKKGRGSKGTKRPSGWYKSGRAINRHALRFFKKTDRQPINRSAELTPPQRRLVHPPLVRASPFRFYINCENVSMFPRRQAIHLTNRSFKEILQAQNISPKMVFRGQAVWGIIHRHPNIA
jgi:hypothetical protein